MSLLIPFICQDILWLAKMSINEDIYLRLLIKTANHYNYMISNNISKRTIHITIPPTFSFDHAYS